MLPASLLKIDSSVEGLFEVLVTLKTHLGKDTYMYVLATPANGMAKTDPWSLGTSLRVMVQAQSKVGMLTSLMLKSSVIFSKSLGLLVKLIAIVMMSSLQM